MQHLCSSKGSLYSIRDVLWTWRGHMQHKIFSRLCDPNGQYGQVTGSCSVSISARTLIGRMKTPIGPNKNSLCGIFFAPTNGIRLQYYSLVMFTECKYCGTATESIYHSFSIKVLIFCINFELVKNFCVRTYANYYGLLVM